MKFLRTNELIHKSTTTNHNNLTQNNIKYMKRREICGNEHFKVRCDRINLIEETLYK